MTARSFWNIAGRAGRPGFDREGQVVLFEPSLGLDKVNIVLDKYLDPSLSTIEPVQSALADSVREISENLENGTFTVDALNENVLSAELPKRVHGTINLLRVGIVHARASRMISSPEDIIEGSFAAQHMNATHKVLARQLVAAQAQVVDKFLSSAHSLPVQMVAELGLSIETLSLLRDYVKNLDDWQIQRMSSIIVRGRVNLDQAQYIVGPVAARMAELEGPKLGGLYTDIILNWISGIPLLTVKAKARNGDSWKRLEDLIALIYSRIQYLLPWGLYALDKIIQTEVVSRRINYNGEIRSLAYLADAGVPTFDALRLVSLDFERVDATRLADYYQRIGGRATGADIVGWLINERREVIERVVSGIDSRRIDYDLFGLIDVTKRNSLRG